jgi:beta-galactosidase
MTPKQLILPSVLAPLFVNVVAAPAQEVPDWENPTVFERGQVAPHATLMPFASLADALEGDRKASPWCLLLSGRWKFHWAPVPEEAPITFFQPGFDATGWDDIEVPSNWQMQGFGHPMFRNIEHTFPSTPPTVPTGYNPVGSYLRTFELPTSWAGRRVLLHFEGVKSASYVWINGREVGYNQGGMEPAEYDVTEHLQAGANTIAVQVYRFSDGTYLEDQDMWRLAGIYRDVYLMATPPVHVRDFFITTDRATTGMSWPMDTASAPHSTRATTPCRSLDRLRAAASRSQQLVQGQTHSPYPSRLPVSGRPNTLTSTAWYWSCWRRTAK